MRSMLLFALALSAPALLAQEGVAVDVAVVSVSEDVVVVDAVRAGVVVAARERDLKVVDLLAQGLLREWNGCRDLACRRGLATRRGAEWHIVVDAAADVDLRLLDGDKELAAVRLQGPRFAQLGRVNAAVDELLDQVRPRAEVERARLLQQSRDLRKAGDVRGAAVAAGAAFAKVVDDKAVDVFVGWVKALDDAGDAAAVDAAYDAAESALLAPESPLSPSARARFVAPLGQHRWQRALLLSAIADADSGPDHTTLALAAQTAWQKLSTSTWADPDLQKRASDQAARYGVDAVIPSP